jgi:hypothetical protein
MENWVHPSGKFVLGGDAVHAIVSARGFGQLPKAIQLMWGSPSTSCPTCHKELHPRSKTLRCWVGVYRGQPCQQYRGAKEQFQKALCIFEDFGFNHS